MEFKNQYTHGVSGTDMSVLFNVNRFRTPIQLFQVKTGAAAKEEFVSEAALWGKKLEAEILDHFQSKHPEFIIARDDSIIRGDGDIKFICGIPDGYITDDLGNKSILEIKTASLFLESKWGAEGTQDIPHEYMLQIQTYMLITGYEKAYVAVLIGGQQYKEFVIDQDKELQSKIIERATKFWKCVLDDHLDQEFFTETDFNYNPIIDDAHTADDELQGNVFLLAELKTKLNSLKKQETELIGKVVTAAGNHSTIIDASGRKLASYNEYKRVSFNAKAFKEQRPDDYDFFLKESKYRRFKLHVKA